MRAKDIFSEWIIEEAPPGREKQVKKLNAKNDHKQNLINEFEDLIKKLTN